jgi:geranylgeranyl diphosphate synthase type II
MLTLEQAQDIISQEFNQINFDKTPQDLYEPIRYVLSLGGKRIRPALVLMACNMFSDNIEKAKKPAIGLEIFHNFTLLHDDIMDNADLRRGHPTVHVKWNNNTGILSGDAMSIVAYMYICTCPPHLLSDILKVFNQTALEVCEGQQYDMDFEKLSNVEEDMYLKMIELKTSVLLACCLKIGALLGDASAKDADLLYEFGRNVGLAFQLQDDLLDVFGDVAVFGKEIGNDIISNKKTYLLIKALENANDKQKATLNYYLNLKQFDKKEKIEAVKLIYNELDIKQLALNKIDSYFQKAYQYLNQLSVAEERKVALIQFAEELKERKK